MGMIWRSTMVLLSTLAALVIIVHSAEEEYEAQYNRGGLRPRILETDTSQNEQPWRTVEVEPVIQASTSDKWLDISSEESPRRRRPGRKRKRRPIPSSNEDLGSNDRFANPEGSAIPYYELDSRPNRKISETPKRRRRKPDTRAGWDETHAQEERPLRRRGLKRKRPTEESWPVFSEFNDYIPNEAPIDTNPESEQADKVSVIDDYQHFDERDTGYGFEQEQRSSFRSENPESESKSISINKNDYLDHYTQPDPRYSEKHNEKDASSSKTKIDKPLSEFTVDDVNDMRVPSTNQGHKIQKIRDKSYVYAKQMDKVKDNGPLDPLTLKEILKRSNGTSLSEILQQHNLSLTDLLHGKEDVISILKSEGSIESRSSKHNISLNAPYGLYNKLLATSVEENHSSEEKLTLSSENQPYASDMEVNSPATPVTLPNIEEKTIKVENIETTTTENFESEDSPKRPNIRRFPTGIRRKQRIRPMMNNTLKSQVSRDMIALNARKYLLNSRRRNGTRQEWKDLIPLMKKNVTNDNNKTKPEIETSTVSEEIEETTTSQDIENCTKLIDNNIENIELSQNKPEYALVTQNETTDEVPIEILKPMVHEKTKIVTNVSQNVNASSLRRQAFNNRLKNKRMKQKNLTTEPPQDDIMSNLFEHPNLVSSSEFISRTQGPKTSLDDVTILEDFVTTETPHRQENKNKATRYLSPRPGITPKTEYIPDSTEQSAKIEIEEIFNDNQTSARLTKILMERNMTLNELVEHRERGSSHVHLADIFHNASKEPNPPEPFLSKSLIEPISKETYPLRALLEANIHDATTKATTIDPALGQATEINIPIIMDFRKNVNENAENMGIVSLFSNITKNEINNDQKIMKDSQGTPYQSTITVVNTTDLYSANNTARESRLIHINDNNDDVVSWNEIFSLMRQNYENSSDVLPDKLGKGLISAETIKKPVLEDVDGDGVIVLEDLQHLNEFDSNIQASASNENLNFNSYEKAEAPTKAPGVLETIPSQTKSVTVATASVAGLAMILFLLTYVGYKWQQQRSEAQKKNFAEERVPTPVFESRKGHKNNSSTRSISPMLSSNIYTLNTLDSRNGKESPDYMWDSLRKPFQ